MVRCSSLDNPKFQEGGIFHDIIHDTWTLCPETGDLNYNGFAGTNLWVIPKGDLTNKTVQESLDQVEIGFMVVTESFSIKEFTKAKPAPFAAAF